MKKFLYALIVAIGTAALLPFNISAGSREIKILIDGAELNIPAEYGHPYYDEYERVQIPMRYIAEVCGYEVEWDAESQTADIITDKGIISVETGSKEMKTPSGTVYMDTAACVNSDGRIYIPLRYVMEAAGLEVTWKAERDCDIISISGSSALPFDKPMTPKEVSKKASPSVFYIEVKQGGNVTGSGSGFFISPDGTAVTNYHVIENTTDAVITTTDGEQYPVESVLFYDISNDIAVLKISDKAVSGTVRKEFPYLETADSDKVENGDKIYAIGSPKGLQNSITDGIISNNQRVSDNGHLYLQISAPISSGSSGGALLNEHAQVIGITTASVKDGQNLNLAVPINLVTNGLKNVNEIPYREVYETEFRRFIEGYTAELGERLWEEDTSGSLAVNYIDSGDTFIGSFERYDEIDFYEFFTPIPVYATVSGGALFDATGNKSEDDKIKASFIFTINKEVNEPYLTGEMVSDDNGNMVRIASKKYLEPGKYYIAVLQSVNDKNAWKDKNYFLYMTLEAAE